MTDNEVIKALECCLTHTKCEECPMNQKRNCMTELMKNALDLINRQKAEIERLQKSLEEAISCFNRMETLYKIKCKELEIAKSEAIKEFSKMIIDKSENGIVYISDIPDYVKEMAEVS